MSKDSKKQANNQGILREILKRDFGHDHFRGDQENTIQAVLAQKNVLCLMPTGMGKSLCYQIPTRIQGGLTLVISPLIALMQDQVSKLKKMGFKACDIHSLLKKEEREKRYKKLSQGEYEIILVAPERFRKEEFWQALHKNKVQLLVVDEAHCVSEWGHDFRPDYTLITEFRKKMNNPTTLMITATATQEVQNDIIKNVIGIEPFVRFHSGIKRDNLNIQVHDLYEFESKAKKIMELKEANPQIIYFSLISTLEKFSDFLKSQKINHLTYHGQLPRSIRQRNQRDFIDGQYLMLATPAFGLGIDKQDIRTIIHFEVPASLESYYQEIGRAGRDGKPSNCHLLYDEQDLTIQMEFIKWTHPDEEYMMRVYNLLKNNEAKSNSHGLEYLKEELHFKSSKDFRLETTLNLFDRWGVSEGDIENKDFKIISEIPEHLLDKKSNEKKMKNSQMQLLKMVEFVKTDEEKLPFIYEYFGV